MIKEKSNLIIPCHWDTTTIEQVAHQNVLSSRGVYVTEVYGVLANGGPVGHGRSRKSVPEIESDKAIEFRKQLKNLGFSFTYLLNAPFTIDQESMGRQELDDYLIWILKDIQPDALLISSFELMKHLRKTDSRIPIHISTIAGIKNVEDLKKYLDISPQRIVFHHDLGKDLDNLEVLQRYCENIGIETEILVTESCLYRCPAREAHYRYLARKDHDSSYHTDCNTRKLTHPREFLLAGGIIRPEDLQFYEGMGINRFKVSGRSKPAQWLPAVVKAYLDREYHGNLIKLLGIDPSLEAENWIHIDNKALDGFLKGYPFAGSYLDKIHYCDRWIVMFYQAGQFQLLDGTEYAIQNGSLAIKTIGEKTNQVFTKESN